MSWVLEQRSSRVTVTTNKISTASSRTDDFIRATFAIGEFGDSTSRSIAVDLNTSHDKIANFKTDLVASFVGTLAMDGTAFLSE